MSVNRRNAHTEFSKQQILNDSFDRDYMMLGNEVLTENEAGDALVRQKPIATEAQLNNLVGMEIPPHDYIARAWTAGTFTEAWTFYSGGSGGTLVATITIVYDDVDMSNIISVTKV